MPKFWASWLPSRLREGRFAYPSAAGLNRAQIGRWSDARAARGLRWTPASTGSRSGEAKMRSSRRRSRSEEHTSELQSLMRISYAVFSLKKKINNTHKDYKDVLLI